MFSYAISAKKNCLDLQLLNILKLFIIKNAIIRELRFMKKKLFMQQVAIIIFFAAQSIYAYDICNENAIPLKAGRWGFMPVIGLAPALFTFRDSPRRVVPRSALTCPTQEVCIGGTGDPFCLNMYQILTAPENALQIDCPKDPKFSKKFNNAVLQVGGEISYNICDNAQYFIDVIYNRTNGRCFPINTKNYQAPDGCNSCCNTNDCCAISASQPVLTETHLILDYTAYMAYGAYIGTRWYSKRIRCNRLSFFGGFKIGMLHRKAVHANITIGDISVPVGENTYLFAGQHYKTTDFCKSNAVSGGGLIGLDYKINNCFTILVSAEIIATSPLKINPNIKSLPFADPTLNGQPTPQGFGRNFPLPVGLSIGHVGSLLQFPIWVGLRRSFDFCKTVCNSTS